ALDRRCHQVVVEPVVAFVAQGEQAMLVRQVRDEGRFGLRAAAVSWIEPRMAPEIHGRFPRASAMAWRFMPCRLCLPEEKGRSVALRSMRTRVPSRMTNAAPVRLACRSASRMLGARAASRRTVSRVRRHAVAAEIPKPTARSAKRSPLRR